jgi:uncharacterized protein with HEPN domain
MSIDRTPAHLADMLGFVRELRAIAGGHTLNAFMHDRIPNLAVEKLFINLGEAAQWIPEAERADMTGLRWRQVIGLRNILAHGCERIDQQTLYRTACTELAAVERELMPCLATRGRD